MLIFFGVKATQIQLAGLEAHINHWHKVNLNKQVSVGSLWLQHRRVAKAAKLSMAIQLAKENE